VGDASTCPYAPMGWTALGCPRAVTRQLEVRRDTDNPNSVWICLDGDRAVGEQFLQDPEVGKIMQDAGVLASPEVFWVD
jgi:hypothetical protein